MDRAAGASHRHLSGEVHSALSSPWAGTKIRDFDLNVSLEEKLEILKTPKQTASAYSIVWREMDESPDS